MRFLDEAKVYLQSGKGGNGSVSFRREKFVPDGGPDGGDGGRGGSIIFRTTVHMNTLIDFRYQQHFKAKGGEGGKGRRMSGKSGQDLILEVPIGTQIFAEDGESLIYDFTKEGEEFRILKGGRGGIGNYHFKSSRNRAPTKAIPGEDAEELCIWLKLKLISDAGLLGLPNAGKSTFLAGVTAAKPKIADYPFTTLTPNLGVVKIDYEEFVIADIPGLIEGAHLGVGLGHKFLKHVERSGILLHLIDGMAEDVALNYRTIRSELKEYSNKLSHQKEIICLNKIDCLSDKEIEEKTIALKEASGGNKIYPISGATGKNVSGILRMLLEDIKRFKEI